VGGNCARPRSSGSHATGSHRLAEARKHASLTSGQANALMRWIVGGQTKRKGRHLKSRRLQVGKSELRASWRPSGQSLVPSSRGPEKEPKGQRANEEQGTKRARRLNDDQIEYYCCARARPPRQTASLSSLGPDGSQASRRALGGQLGAHLASKWGALLVQLQSNWKLETTTCWPLKASGASKFKWKWKSKLNWNWKCKLELQ